MGNINYYGTVHGENWQDTLAMQDAKSSFCSKWQDNITMQNTEFSFSRVRHKSIYFQKNTVLKKFPHMLFLHHEKQY
ncbi:MAG: hypothetical protein NTU49_07220 [Gammaproteobacteria bacterium]|nr:hypothetical protein [Gammaproteobacteria bacterium]